MSIIASLNSAFFLFNLVFYLFFAAADPLPVKDMANKYGLTFTTSRQNIEQAPERLLKPDLLTMNLAVDDSLPDRNIAEKYGLIIPPPDDKLEPAPFWLQNSDMFTFDWNVWKDHKFIIKDTLLTRIVRIRASYGLKEITEHYPVETISAFDGSLIKGVSLFTQAPHSRKAFEEAHKQGVRAIPYVHFSDIHTNYADQDVFYFQHPEIILKDEKGNWRHMPMDGSNRMYRLLTCANSPVYWKLSLAYIKKMMDWGADGIFLDNVGRHREPCFAPKFNVRNPEFPPYEHEHLFPDASQDYAWDRMLQTIRALVKSYGEDKIVLLNSGIGTQFQKYGDCDEWESFIYSWAWEGRQHTWQDVKKKAQDNAWYLNAGRRITAKSFLNRSGKDIKNDAFWAFSAARLVDFIWWSELTGTGAESLYMAHMGKGLSPFKETNGLVFRFFENGLIVLNDSEEDQNIELPLTSGFMAKGLMDLYNGSRIIQVKNRKIKVSVAKKTARVYLLPQNQ
jgi:hypothetical protein